MHAHHFLPGISLNYQIIIALWLLLAGQKNDGVGCKKLWLRGVALQGRTTSQGRIGCRIAGAGEDVSGRNYYSDQIGLCARA